MKRLFLSVCGLLLAGAGFVAGCAHRYGCATCGMPPGGVPYGSPYPGPVLQPNSAPGPGTVKPPVPGNTSPGAAGGR